MNKKLIAAFAAALVLSGCGAKIKNPDYSEYLKKAGHSAEEIARYEEYEKTNKNLPDGGYIDVTGKTAEDAAKERGLSFEEYLEANSLPENMSPLVSETEAQYTVPVSKEAEFYGMGFEEFKQMLELPENLKEDTPWGVALGETTIGAYIGEENAESFIKEYNLGKNVTAKTKWKKVREAVDAVKRDRRKESENNG